MDWTGSGTEEVAPGVHRIPLPLPMDGLRAVNVYALIGPEGATLVDGGWKIDSARLALDAALSGLGLSASDIGRCLVTHHHRDHYTMAVDLRRRVGLRVALGAGERPNLDAFTSETIAFGPQRAALVGAGAAHVADQLGTHEIADADRADYEHPDDWLADGERIDLGHRRLRVRSTPGHTSGHVVYVDDDAGLMFAGDHVLPHITPSIGFQAAVVDHPLTEYLSSLAIVLQEPDRILLPAHGPAGGSVHERTLELLEHHHVRLGQTEAAVRAGAQTAFAAAGVLGWTRRLRKLSELDVFNQMLAVLETEAHLDVLVAQGRVQVRTEDHLRIYNV